jgi:hypothetical protein
VLTACQRISDWYANARKAEKRKQRGLPYAKPAQQVLDLSGKSRRKTVPYQLHQAYSILHWRPDNAPLCREVEELWAKRTEASVCKTLQPFLKETVSTSTTTSEMLLFHMAVMRWKCSLLPPDELTVLQNWVSEQHALKETARALPWFEEANKHGDPLFAENTFIQRSVISLFSSELMLTISPVVPLTASRPQCRQPSKRSSVKQVGKQWSSLVVSSLGWDGFPVTCKTPSHPPFHNLSKLCVDM